GFEPATPCLGSKCSTTELLPHTTPASSVPIPALERSLTSRKIVAQRQREVKTDFAVTRPPAGGLSVGQPGSCRAGRKGPAMDAKAAPTRTPCATIGRYFLFNNGVEVAH